jgi:hypothetical protein
MADVGDGGGIAVAFFALAATLRAGRWRNGTVIAVAAAYAVFPVWTGLVLTDLFAPHDQRLFPLSLTTLTLSLVGHLIYGAFLGLGYCRSRSLEALWPVQLRVSRGQRKGRRGPSETRSLADPRNASPSPAY